jgi:hypothetical protein
MINNSSIPTTKLSHSVPDPAWNETYLRVNHMNISKAIITISEKLGFSDF